MLNFVKEKDRRNELLVQKLRKIKKALSVRRDDDENSERSIGSSIALDTIAEDLDEDPVLMVNGDIQPTIYEQLEFANVVMNELCTLLDIDSVSSLPDITVKIIRCFRKTSQIVWSQRCPDFRKTTNH